MSRVLFALVVSCFLGAHGISDSQSPTDIVAQSNVVWSDCNWKGDGTGSMPLGNGDVTANVWIDNATGDLRILFGKSDVFDENAQPVKVGLIAIAFEPPLWNYSHGLADFKQSLNLPEATIDIETLDVSLRVFVGSTDSSVRVVASAKKIPSFKIKARVIPYRRAGKTLLGRGFCHDRYDRPDVVVGAERPSTLSQAVVWYHRNPDNASYFKDTMLDQGVSPADVGLKDRLAGLTFGAAVFGDGLTASADDFTEVSSGSVGSASVGVMVLTKQATEQEWIKELSTLVAGAASAKTALSAHAKSWAGIWNRSYLSITGRANATQSDTEAAKAVMDHAHWQRFLDLVQGMKASSPIKFNGQAFAVNNTGKGWDYRDWGAAYWWQNTRQPYYNSLAQGDLDVLRGMFDFYHRMLPYVQARTAAQFNGTKTPITGGGALYPETTTQFGCYDPGDWGCNSGGHRADGASSNAYIRFHWTGSLELCLLFLDDYGVTQDSNYFTEKGLPVCTAVVDGFRQRFPNVDNTTGKTDMWPAQAIETYQCTTLSSRTDCPTNPTTDISGLKAVLPRLLALPKALLPESSELRTQWAAQLKLLPDITISNGVIQPAAQGASHRRNSENTALYAVHPFRLYTSSKSGPELEVGVATYQHRPSKCNNGWCQDVIDAAMLGLTDDAMKMVAQRAAAGPAKGFRFPGFAAHNQDFEPSLDHYAFMRTAINYMLMSPLDDESASVVLFPSWPVDKWDVSFKMIAPLNTVIEAACVNGTLTRLIVTPSVREKDVKVLNCRDTRHTESELIV